MFGKEAALQEASLIFLHGIISLCITAMHPNIKDYIPWEPLWPELSKSENWPGA